MLISISNPVAKTPAEIQKLPTFSMEVAEDAYRLTDKIYIDNRHGLGETPDNRNVKYKGCVSVLPIDTFLKLARPGGYDVLDRASQMDKKVEEGFGWGNPCLYLSIDPIVQGDDGVASVEGHEGRARATYFKANGIRSLPVQLFFSGYRARHVKSNPAMFLKWLNEGIRNEQGTEVYKDLFKEVLFG